MEILRPSGSLPVIYQFPGRLPEPAGEQLLDRLSAPCRQVPDFRPAAGVPHRLPESCWQAVGKLPEQAASRLPERAARVIRCGGPGTCCLSQGVPVKV